jgi:hypothetical protein
MAAWEEAIVEFVKWIRDSNRPAWVFFIVTGAILLLPQSWLATLGVVTWVVNYKPWIVLLCAVSLVWLATSPFVVWHEHYKIKDRLKNSAKDERFILAQFVRADSAVCCVSLYYAHSAESLIRDKILFDTQQQDNSGSPFIGMNPYVFRYLRKNKDIVGIKPLNEKD